MSVTKAAYIYINALIHICMCVHICIYRYRDISINLLCIYTHTIYINYKCVNTYTYIYMHIYTYGNMSTYLCHFYIEIDLSS